MSALCKVYRACFYICFKKSSLKPIKFKKTISLFFYSIAVLGTLFCIISKGVKTNMTKKEKVTIYRLKRKGYTAADISKVTGVPYGTIRSMFSRHPEYKEEGVCQCCGKHFEITIINPFKRFCSKDCKQT